MRLHALLLVLFLATSAMAGCLGGEDDSQAQPTGAGDASAEDEDQNEGDEQPQEEENGRESEREDSNDTNQAEEDPQGPEVTTIWHNGTVQGQSAPVLGPVCMFSCGSNSMTFDVPNETRGLVVEIAWEADASLLLDVDVPAEHCEADVGEDCRPESTSGDDGYLEVRLEDESLTPPGEWSASAWAEDSPTEAVEFTIVASTFHGGQVPPDYAKLDAGS